MNYITYIQSLTKAQISRPKTVLRLLLVMSHEAAKRDRTHSFWYSASNLEWLNAKLVTTLASSENKEDESENRDLTAFLAVINQDPRVDLLLANGEMMALLGGFFSCYPEYILHLTSYKFISMLSLNFDWMQPTIKPLLEQYATQLDSKDSAASDAAYDAFRVAVPVLTPRSLLQLINRMLPLITAEDQKIKVRVHACKILRAAMRFAESEKQIEIHNLFAYLSTNEPNRNIRRAITVSTAPKIAFMPQHENTQHEIAPLSQNERMIKRAREIHFAERISLIRNVAFGFKDENPRKILDFNALTYIFDLHEIQSFLLRTECNRLPANVQQIIKGYSLPRLNTS